MISAAINQSFYFKIYKFMFDIEFGYYVTAVYQNIHCGLDTHYRLKVGLSEVDKQFNRIPKVAGTYGNQAAMLFAINVKLNLTDLGKKDNVTGNTIEDLFRMYVLTCYGSNAYLQYDKNGGREIILVPKAKILRQPRQVFSNFEANFKKFINASIPQYIKRMDISTVQKFTSKVEKLLHFMIKAEKDPNLTKTNQLRNSRKVDDLLDQAYGNRYKIVWKDRGSKRKKGCNLNFGNVDINKLNSPQFVEYLEKVEQEEEEKKRRRLNRRISDRYPDGQILYFYSRVFDVETDRWLSETIKISVFNGKSNKIKVTDPRKNDNNIYTPTSLADKYSLKKHDKGTYEGMRYLFEDYNHTKCLFDLLEPKER